MAAKSTSSFISQWNLITSKVDIDLDLEKSFDRNFVLKAAKVDWSKIKDIFIPFDYRGDRGMCLMKGVLQTDNFYTSKPWTVGLKRYAEELKNNEMYFYFVPMEKGAPYISYLDKNVVPEFGDKKEFLEIKDPIIEIEYRLDIQIK